MTWENSSLAFTNFPGRFHAILWGLLSLVSYVQPFLDFFGVLQVKMRLLMRSEYYATSSGELYWETGCSGIHMYWGGWNCWFKAKLLVDIYGSEIHIRERGCRFRQLD